MAATDSSGQVPGRRRAIGVLGTGARVILGVVLLGSVLQGELRAGATGPLPAALAFGIIGLPALVLLCQWSRARRTPTRLQATGPLASALNVAVFAALFLTPWYAPSISFTSDVALVFYGTSMLVAGLRGYAGCEVLAVSNWLLRRDDQVGCLVVTPFDHLERRIGRS